MDDQNTTNEENIQNAPAEGQQISEPKSTEVPTEEAESESVSSDVIASEAKQSSSDDNPTKIATDPSDLPQDGTIARNDEGEADTSESTTTEESTEQSAEAADTAETPTTDAPKNDNPNAKWYVVHTYSGHENKVAHTLKQRIESEHLGDKILDVLVPMQDKIEIKSGKKVNIKEKIFPGYILVKMVLDDTSWLAVRTTQGVTSFVGMGNKPTPISEAEVATIVKFTQSEAPMYKQVFTVNDTVKIVDGPFADFIGKIDSVDEEKGKVRVLVSIFGRETPVELDFLQIKKI